jgi:predicted 2-oxoglutarate/Fe(II)-dependent dioxygenase YbiX/peroxiredoxin
LLADAEKTMSQYVPLQPGQPAPWFRQRCTSNPDYAFHTVAGRYIVLCFFGSARDAPGQRALQFVDQYRSWFDDARMAFFGISGDPQDEAIGRVKESLPGVRHIWDFDGTASRLYGSLPATSPDKTAFKRQWVVLDPGLHVLAVFPFLEDGSDCALLARFLERLPPVASYAGLEVHAPVLIVPNLLEPALCKRLIAVYEADGGASSGVMRDINGKTTLVSDAAHKRRSDVTLQDQRLVALLQARVRQKLVPLVHRATCFEVTRMERYIVACYDSKDSGHFRPHRDNTTPGTAHRRFALSVNLNDAFEGGTLSFPEYGPRAYKMPAGTGVVFSCSLLHQVAPVTQGRRYAFLPFLYDDAAAAVREKNNRFLDTALEAYKA